MRGSDYCWRCNPDKTQVAASEEKRRASLRRTEPEAEESLIAPTFVEVGDESQRIVLEAARRTGLNPLNFTVENPPNIVEARVIMFGIQDNQALYRPHYDQLIRESKIFQRLEKIKKLQRYG
jgi:hypothetical protein